MSFFAECMDSQEQVVHIEDKYAVLELSYLYIVQQVDIVAYGASSAKTNSSSHQAFVVLLLPGQLSPSVRITRSLPMQEQT